MGQLSHCFPHAEILQSLIHYWIESFSQCLELSSRKSYAAGCRMQTRVFQAPSPNSNLDRPIPQGTPFQLPPEVAKSKSCMLFERFRGGSRDVEGCWEFPYFMFFQFSYFKFGHVSVGNSSFGNLQFGNWQFVKCQLRTFNLDLPIFQWLISRL